MLICNSTVCRRLFVHFPLVSFSFSFLDRVDDTNLFIGLSFAIRIVEAMGNAGFLTASFSIIAKEFPDNVATTFVSAVSACSDMNAIQFWFYCSGKDGHNIFPHRRCLLK